MDSTAGRIHGKSFISSVILLLFTSFSITCTFLNGCAGAAYPQNSFDEAELSDPADYIRRKHSRDFDKFEKELRPGGQVVYTWRGTVTYIYEFNEL